MAWLWRASGRLLRWPSSRGTYLAIGNVVAHRLGGAPRRLAITAGACRLDHQAISGCQSRYQLRGNDLGTAVAAFDPRTRAGAGQPAVHACRRHKMPFTPMRKGKCARDVVEDFEFFDLPQATAPGAGAAGIGSEAPAIDANRRLELHGFGRQVHAIGGIG